MTLSNGQALVGAYVPTLASLRETAKLSPDARTLRAIRWASISGTFVTAKVLIDLGVGDLRHGFVDAVESIASRLATAHLASSLDRAVVRPGCLSSPSGCKSCLRRTRASQRFLRTASSDLPSTAEVSSRLCPSTMRSMTSRCRRWQEAEDVCRPFVVFRCRQPTVLGTFGVRDVAALDETLDYALVPARRGLDVVTDNCPARVRKRARLYRSLPEHLQHGLRGRVLASSLVAPTIMACLISSRHASRKKSSNPSGAGSMRR